MAFYENQYDMFKQRAEKCKDEADKLYAKAMNAKDAGNSEEYKKYYLQSQKKYEEAKMNEEKAEKYKDSSWKK